MVDHPVFPVGCLFPDTVVEKMAGKLAGGTAPLLQAPDNAPGISGLVDLRNAQVVLRCQGNIAEILAAAGGDKKLPFQIVCLDAHVYPLAGGFFKIGAALLHLFRAHAIGQIAAVALVPALVPAVAAQADVILQDFTISNCHGVRFLSQLSCKTIAPGDNVHRYVENLGHL